MSLKKSNLAWFKLSETLSRKEREKALFVFRLLSHSIDSDAFKYQIIGYIHLELEETEKALSLFFKSFNLYCENNEFYPAYLILSIASSITKDIEKYFDKLAEINHNTKLYTHFISNIIHNLESKFSFSPLEKYSNKKFSLFYSDKNKINKIQYSI